MAGDKDNTKQMQVTIQRPGFQPSATKRRAANRDEDKEMPSVDEGRGRRSHRNPEIRQST